MHGVQPAPAPLILLMVWLQDEAEGLRTPRLVLLEAERGDTYHEISAITRKKLKTLEGA
jgi:hypothetical protein